MGDDDADGGCCTIKRGSGICILVLSIISFVGTVICALIASFTHMPLYAAFGWIHFVLLIYLISATSAYVCCRACGSKVTGGLAVGYCVLAFVTFIVLATGQQSAMEHYCEGTVECASISDWGDHDPECGHKTSSFSLCWVPETDDRRRRLAAAPAYAKPEEASEKKKEKTKKKDRKKDHTITKSSKIKTNESPSSSVQSLEQRRVLVTSCPITRDFCTNDASLPDNCNCGDCGYPACGDCDCDYYGDGQCCTGSCTSWLSAHERCHDAHATGDDVSCCVGGDIRATCQCAAHYEWWDDRRLSAVDEPRRLGHCCDYGAYCSCMESELGAGCTAPDCGGDDWDEDDEECDIETFSDLNSSPGGTTNHGAGDGWCYSDLDEFVGCAASPGDCWAMCLGYYGDGLVAIDWWSDEGGQCYCQHECECMEDVGAGAGYTVTRDSRVGALPHECGPDEGDGGDWDEDEDEDEDWMWDGGCRPDYCTSTDGGYGYDCCASMDWGEPATCANGYTPMPSNPSEDDCEYTCCPASVTVSGSVTLYEDKSRGAGCDALSYINNVVDADSADHCCQDEDYCCNYGSCAPDSDYCGHRFHCQGFLVTGDLTFEGITYEAAQDNTEVFVAAVADLCGVAASAVTVEIWRARRRRLAEGILVTYTVSVATANEAQTVTSAISSSSTADVDAAISNAATDAGVDGDFDGVTTTNVGTPTTLRSDGTHVDPTWYYSKWPDDCQHGGGGDDVCRAFRTQDDCINYCYQDDDDEQCEDVDDPEDCNWSIVTHVNAVAGWSTFFAGLVLFPTLVWVVLLFLVPDPQAAAPVTAVELPRMQPQVMMVSPVSPGGGQPQVIMGQPQIVQAGQAPVIMGQPQVVQGAPSKLAEF